MKKVLFLIFVMFVSILVVQGSCAKNSTKDSGNVIVHEGIAYAILNDDEVEVTSLPGKKKYAGEVIIPSFITIIPPDGLLDNNTAKSSENDIVKTRKTYSIVGIGEGAFKGCKDLVILGMPRKLREIGREAVAGCKNLLKIKMPGYIDKIGDSAFEGSKFPAMTITGNIGEIGNRVFYGIEAEDISLQHCNLSAFGENTFTNSNIMRVYLPKNLKVIPNNTFKNCRKLFFVGFNKVLEEIGANAFEGCRELKALSLPASLASIGKDAFSGVTIKSLAFEKVTAPDFKIECISNGALPYIIAFPSEGENSYKNWCPEMFVGKLTLFVKHYFKTWIYPSIIESLNNEEIKNILQNSVWGDFKRNVCILSNKPANISIIYPTTFGAGSLGTNTLIEDNGEVKELNEHSEGETFLYKYTGCENFVIIKNLNVNATLKH